MMKSSESMSNGRIYICQFGSVFYDVIKSSNYTYNDIIEDYSIAWNGRVSKFG